MRAVPPGVIVTWQAIPGARILMQTTCRRPFGVAALDGVTLLAV